MSYFTEFDNLVTFFGGRAALADLLGVGPSALSNYRKRGQIPAKKRALLISALAMKHKELSGTGLAIRPLGTSSRQPSTSQNDIITNEAAHSQLDPQLAPRPDPQPDPHFDPQFDPMSSYQTQAISGGALAPASINHALQSSQSAELHSFTDGAKADASIHHNQDDNQIKGMKQPVALLIITGGIAAYKALSLARRMMEAGWQVRGVMTKSAQQFITPLSFSALTAEKIYTDLFSLTDEHEMGHIRLAREADIVLIVPATGNFIAKIALGLADDLASTLCLASDAPLYFVPAMNPVMWANPAIQSHCKTLQDRGAIQIGPVSGDTACGEIGAGRMADEAQILAALPPANKPSLHQQSTSEPLAKPLLGRHIIVTAGPTEEPIDGVRYISNRSSGKQGYAIAKAAKDAGAQVTLITGPTNLQPADGITVIQVTTARQMHQASLAALPADCAICTAAVADWHVADAGHSKIKKQAGAQPPILKLVENPDILKTISHCDNRPSLVIGFAAETDDPITAAMAKADRKGCDWILVNHITKDNPIFGSDSNQLTLIRGHKAKPWPQNTKEKLAEKLTDEIASYFEETKTPITQ